MSNHHLVAHVRLVAEGDLAHQSLERQLGHEQVRRVLVAANLAQRNGARAVAAGGVGCRGGRYDGHPFRMAPGRLRRQVHRVTSADGTSHWSSSTCGRLLLLLLRGPTSAGADVRSRGAGS
ncbi:hypothetical protein TYRP_012084 [Tyrophagus putrescentiae]|nr:hypothetical protein TYRP_012084 [Tyrophagus putrescentiae]